MQTLDGSYSRDTGKGNVAAEWIGLLYHVMRCACCLQRYALALRPLEI